MLLEHHPYVQPIRKDPVRQSSRVRAPRRLKHPGGRAGVAAEHALRADPAQSVREPLDRHGTPGTMTAGGMAALDAADALRPWRQAYEGAVVRLRGAAPSKR